MTIVRRASPLGELLSLRPRAAAVKPRQIRISPTIDGRSAADAVAAPTGTNGSAPAREA